MSHNESKRYLVYIRHYLMKVSTRTSNSPHISVTKKDISVDSRWIMSCIIMDRSNYIIYTCMFGPDWLVIAQSEHFEHHSILWEKEFRYRIHKQCHIFSCRFTTVYTKKKKHQQNKYSQYQYISSMDNINTIYPFKNNFLVFVTTIRRKLPWKES